MPYRHFSSSMFLNVREGASSLGIANGRTTELVKQAARAIKTARTSILATDVLADVRSGLVAIHLAVNMDGGNMLMSVVMSVWMIESRISLGLRESCTTAICRKTRNTASALNIPFRKTAVSVCFTTNLLRL
jgi:hypothetical protein